VNERTRRERGIEVWEGVTAAPVKEPNAPLREAMLDFVAAEVWGRPGLTRKQRRIISLSCAGASAQPIPIRAHVRSALDSGDMTHAELNEFALHFAVYAGWPLASFVQKTIDEVVAERQA
jgi:4-carboxymuconolactone decarboxylase